MAWETCKTIKITLKNSPKEVLAEVKKKCSANNMVVKGDEKKGEISHKKYEVKGVYSVKGQIITITMKEDEWLNQCPKINREVQEWFKGK